MLAGAIFSVQRTFATSSMTDLLVIGGVALDVLSSAGQTALVAGGAGVYAAAAARRMGASVTLVAPRPQPLPEPLRPLAVRMRWIGPSITPAQLPCFQATRQPDGRVEFRRVSPDDEVPVTPDDLPADLTPYRLVHVAPAASVRRQWSLLQAARQRGASRIATGIHPCAVADELEVVRALYAQADIFFVNEIEAGALFGATAAARTAPGRLLFVTLGAQGVQVVQGARATRLPAPSINELDPTGAGDAFCGAALAGLAQDWSPLEAAGRAVRLAAQVASSVGSSALWRDSPF